MPWCISLCRCSINHLLRPQLPAVDAIVADIPSLEDDVPRRAWLLLLMAPHIVYFRHQPVELYRRHQVLHSIFCWVLESFSVVNSYGDGEDMKIDALELIGRAICFVRKCSFFCHIKFVMATSCDEANESWKLFLPFFLIEWVILLVCCSI